ncbi:MAG: polyketide cyclase [Rhodospirillales bacterium]|nr:polyketide cyclase [Rhodospirillales bacterium]
MPDNFDPITGFDPANVARSETVEINAPASLVWEILTDLPRYGEWNPFCVKAVSTLEIGAPIYMTLANFWNDQLALNIEYVCAVEPERVLSWELKHTPEWPYAARRDQVITALGPDRCSYYTTDEFYGDTGVHVMRFCGGWVKAAFDGAARALKTRAEVIYAHGNRAGK